MESEVKNLILESNTLVELAEKLKKFPQFQGEINLGDLFEAGGKEAAEHLTKIINSPVTDKPSPKEVADDTCFRSVYAKEREKRKD